MIASLAGSFVVMSCLGCSSPPADSKDVSLDVGPVEGSQSFQSSTRPIDPTFTETPQSAFGLPLRVGNDFSPSNWSGPDAAARFKALDLSTPMAIRNQQGDLWSAELSFAASAERTGLGLDLSITPRAQIQQNQAGSNVSRTGAELRLGPNLVDRDLRGTDAPAPSWYFFVGADNEALVWNLADKRAMNGVALRDQATVGDLQAGIAWSVKSGGQMSLGLVERELRFNDIAGENDVERKDHFAAFSYTLRH